MTRILSLRQGTQADLDLILAMIEEAADWLRTKNTDQWARPWPSARKRDERVWRGLRDRKTWIAMDENIPVATITCREEGHPRLWSAGDQAIPAAYVSRLIVSRAYGGQGIGESLVDWAGLSAFRCWRAQWVRIDVWTTNETLHGYYKEKGFQHVKTRHELEGRYPSAALFQKPTSEISPAACERFVIVEPGGDIPQESPGLAMARNLVMASDVPVAPDLVMASDVSIAPDLVMAPEVYRAMQASVAETR